MYGNETYLSTFSPKCTPIRLFHLAPSKLLLARSPMTALLLTPTVKSQSSSPLVCQQHDTVDHDLLLKTPSLLCFQESPQLLIFFLHHWFFLSQSSLLILSHFSNTSILDCPQGPGLKPLLFSSYPHFLGDPIHSHGFKFYLYFNTQFCNASSTSCLDLPLYVLRVYMYI